MVGEREGKGVREGVTNKRKQSIEHECLQDFAWIEWQGRVYMDTWKEAER